jgi:hypothetical protein
LQFQANPNKVNEIHISTKKLGMGISICNPSYSMQEAWVRRLQSEAHPEQKQNLLKK